MKPAPFRYLAAGSLPEALGALDPDGSAKVLAGGQSLVAALNMRLSAPDLLVDINRIDDLRGIAERDGGIRVGALARHCDVASSPLIRNSLPLVTAAMVHVAHPAVRNRGTLCGSLAYADPAAEMPACAVALDATLILASSAGTRAVPARAFFHGLYETECRPDEILTEVLWPAARPGERFGFGEVALRHGDFPAVGVAVRALTDGPRVHALDLVVFGSEPKPLLCEDLPGTAGQAVWGADVRDAIVEAALGQMDPMGNHQGSPAVKRRQATALLARVLDETMRRDHHVR